MVGRRGDVEGSILNLYRSLESGTVLLECKDGPWAPQREEDILACKEL